MDSGRKAGQFNIYSNQAETNLLYRIESYYSPMQKIDLRTYPDKKVIGRLNSHQLGIWYQATYEIFDIRSKTNKWFNGSIKRQSTWFHDEYHVNLAERKITMKNRAFSGRFKFYNEANSLLAMFKMRRNLLSAVTKYDLKIFSDQFPDSIYLLALAAHDNKKTAIYSHNDK